jgi:predicted RNase H-like HicB family nuclease
MKIKVKKEFDGRTFVAYCENVPNVYVQAPSKELLDKRLNRALALLKYTTKERNQPFPIGEDKPIFNVRVRFSSLPTHTLVDLFKQHDYHIEYEDGESVILMNSSYPFNRVHLPQTTHLSPIIIRRLFGANNVIYVNPKNNLKLHRSVP